MRSFNILAGLVLLSYRIGSSNGIEDLPGKFSSKNYNQLAKLPSGSGRTTNEIAADEKWQPADLLERDSRWYTNLLGDRVVTIEWLKACGRGIERHPHLYPHLWNGIPFLNKLRETFLQVRDGKEDLQNLHMQLDLCMKVFKSRDLTSRKGNEAVATFFAMLAFITEAGNELDEPMSKTSQEVREWLKDSKPLRDDLNEIISKHKTFEKLNDALIMLWNHLRPIELPDWIRSMM